MPLQEQTISLNFGQGLDTKTDPKMVVPTKLILLQDGIFTNAKRVSKRNGYDAMTLNAFSGSGAINPITSPMMVRAYKNQLILAGQSTGGGRLFSYSQTLNAWSDVGKYLSVAVSKQIIASSELNWATPSGSAFAFSTGTTNSSGALLNNLVCYGFDQSNQGQSAPFVAAGVYWSVIDQENGANLFGINQIISPYGFTWGFSKVITLGASKFAIFYVSDTSNSSVTLSDALFSNSDHYVDRIHFGSRSPSYPHVSVQRERVRLRRSFYAGRLHLGRIGSKWTQ